MLAGFLIFSIKARGLSHSGEFFFFPKVHELGIICFTIL